MDSRTPAQSLQVIANMCRTPRQNGEAEPACDLNRMANKDKSNKKVVKRITHKVKHVMNEYVNMVKTLFMMMRG